MVILIGQSAITVLGATILICRLTIIIDVACVAVVQRGGRGDVECEREARSLGARRERSDRLMLISLKRACNNKQFNFELIKDYMIGSPVNPTGN